MRYLWIPCKILAVIMLLSLLVSAGYTGYMDVTGPNPVSIMFAGDILLDRGVGDAIEKNGKYYPYGEIKKILQQADISAANLECPLTERGIPSLKNRHLVFRADTGNAYALKDAGFDLLNLANNHAMDYGHTGLDDTLNALKKVGIMTVGAGLDSAAARQPVFIEKNGLKLGFLGYSTFPGEGYFYFSDRPDVCRADVSCLSEEINRAREKCDILVVSFHWGKEFDFYPSADQQELAHLAVDGGADIVIGHHPHVLQGVEEYKDRLIFYSLGNFVFDRQIPEGTDETVMVCISVTGDGISSAEIIPVMINSCRPEEAGGESATYVLERMKLYSKRFGTAIEIKGDRGYIFFDIL